MTMTNEEICRSFRNAQTPRKQIGILAELNQCDRSRIVDILREGREGLPWLISMEELEKGRVARSAVAVIDKLLKALDTGGYGEAEAYNFVEQVRGVLALARVLTEGDEHDG